MRRYRSALVIPIVVGSTLAASSAAHATPPDNDLFADRMIVAAGDTVVVDTTEATTGEPEDFDAKEACGSPPFGVPDPPDATVWFSLTVPADEWILLSAAPPAFVTPGFNVLVDTGVGLTCETGGPVEQLFLARGGVEYLIQSIDDQIPEDWDGTPEGLDTEHGGILTMNVISLGAPGPEICPGIYTNDPRLPPGFNVIVGTDSDDVLDGTPGDDAIVGKDGNDTINGHGGNDFLFGCGGDDVVDGGDGDDMVIGDSADYFGDPTSTSGGNDTLTGGDGNDDVQGGPGNDDVAGNSGDDGVFGNQGDDIVNGNNGSDFLGGGYGNDVVNGGQGDDGVTGGPGDDRLNGGEGDDFMTGDFPNGMSDPTMNVDHCNGAQGDDEIIFCEAGNGK